MGITRLTIYKYDIYFISMKNNIKVYQESITKFSEEAKKVVITDDESLEQASKFLSSLNKMLDAVQAEKFKITAPLNEALKVERARWKPFETVYEDLIADTRKKLSVYQTAKMKQAEADYVNIAKQVGKGKLDVNTAQEKIDLIVQPHKKVAKVSFREDKVLKIINIAKIPDEYWVIDEKAVKEALKAGKEVPGATLDTVLTPVDLA